LNEAAVSKAALGDSIGGREGSKGMVVGNGKAEARGTEPAEDEREMDRAGKSAESRLEDRRGPGSASGGPSFDGT
jgi:hypothetical protein